MRSIKRIGAGLLTVVALAGCQTKGHNMPLEEAMFRVVEPLVAERVQVVPVPPAPPAEVVRMGGGLWQPGFREYNLAARQIQPVGRAGGQTFYALSWDREPFDRLLVEVPGRPGEYLEYLGVY
jgi:hypothetical protein